MAHVRQTPRKRVLHHAKVIPAGLKWSLQPVRQFESNGNLAGHFPHLLRNLLSSLEYADAPLYRGVRTPIEDHGYTWKVEVILYDRPTTNDAKPTTNDANTVWRHHQATAPRTTFWAGIADAARQDLAVLCREFRRELKLSQFSKLPQRARGSLEVYHPEAHGDKDRYYMGLHHDLDTALDELDDMHRRNQEQETCIRMLQEMLEDSD